MGAAFFVLGARLFYLQVISDDFSMRAQKNVVKRKILQPSRGIIYDRNGEMFVTNTPSFDMVIVPGELRMPDTSVFVHYLGVSQDVFHKRLVSAQQYSTLKPSIVEKYISFNKFYGLQEHMWKYEGITFEKRFTRDYTIPVGANFLGYISEVNKKDIDKSSGYYQQGDLIGTSGLERHYEAELRGRKGVKMVLEDVYGREMGVFAEGQYDTLPEKGNDLVVSIDGELQRFAEELMVNKKGAIVAIEPSSGEILTFVSAPVFDPNLLTGTELTRNWRTLARDTLKPLFNRALMARYPPGSIFKVLNALIALQEGTITPNTYYGCAGGFARNKGRPACHGHPSPLNVMGAVQHSCNAYFAGLYVDYLHSSRFDSLTQAYNRWRNYMNLFGVGVKTGVDVPDEKAGLIPSTDFYDRWYGKKRWRGMTIVSNSIGQGEVLMTPLQMANVVCAFANKGWYVRPHFYKGLKGKPHAETPKFDTVRIPIDTAYFNIVNEAMFRVVEAGTGYMAKLPDITMCGKTGTAQNPHGKDHSVFFAFAPKDNPKIAVAVIVENATWGGIWAAPIASLVIEKYLTRKVADEARRQRILEADFIHQKSAFPLLGPQRQAAPPPVIAPPAPAAAPEPPRIELTNRPAGR